MEKAGAGGRLVFSPPGEAARECWEAIPAHHRGVELDAYVIMPNHVHGIIILNGDPNGPRRDVPRLPIGSCKGGQELIVSPGASELNVSTGDSQYRIEHF